MEAKFPVCSDRMKKYFERMQAETKVIYDIANAARAKGYDPEERVDIPLAASIPEKVEALIASVAPQVLNSGIKERICELELKYSAGDWRVALVISAEVAQEKFCKFDKQIDAIATGIRTGLAYVTQGVVSAPLEGIVECKFKKRKDNGKDYLAVFYAGPIRGAGGTGQSISVIIADYVRRQCGIAAYDPTEDEVKRTHTEITDYYDRVERKQYKPSFEETKFIVEHLPVEVDGDPTAELDVSNYKYLDRIETNRIRGGLALVYLDGIALKAAKLWRPLQKWGKEFGLEEWKWLQEFVELKAKLHAQKGEKKDEGGDPIKPDYYFLSEIVAGRPVFSYPMAKGGFRVRYGRSRMTGDGSWAISPMTMHVMNDYLAIGSQLRVERPGKSTALTVCESIDGPVIKLKDGSVVRLNDEATALKYKRDILEILFIGDILISHGDFVEQNHKLMPSAYVPEWWVLDVRDALNEHPEVSLREDMLANPITVRPTFEEAVDISNKLGVPLHPDYCFRWRELTREQFDALYDWVKSTPGTTVAIPNELVKRALELIACPHWVRGDKIVIDEVIRKSLDFNLSQQVDIKSIEDKDILAVVNKISSAKILDVSGYTIGARMGRPEKAKMRVLKGSPHGLFPVGKEGDRLRSLQKAVEVGYVTADFPTFFCEKCNHKTIYPVCELCGGRPIWIKHCPVCKKETTADKCHKETLPAMKQKIDINHYYNNCKTYLGMDQVPPMVKGIRGTSSKTHVCEHMAKALLRAKNNLSVNKDGTIRFDGSELGITHFIPRDIGTPVKKLIEMGYDKDIKGQPLERDDQVVEIYPQDVILPACDECDDEGSDKIMIRTAAFVDELLVRFYHQKPFFNIKRREDLVGHLIIGLAPHTSAGIMSRILGFSHAQALFAHPYWHAIQRRDLDGEETSIMLALDAFINFSRQYLPDRRGTRSVSGDTIIFVEENGTLKAREISELVDGIINKHGSIKEEEYDIVRNAEILKVLAFDSERKVKLMPVSAFIKHKNGKKLLKVKTTNGSICVTEDHSLFVTRGKEIKSICAGNLCRGDAVIVLDKFELERDNKIEINVLDILKDEEIYIVPEEKNLLCVKEKSLTKEIMQMFGENNVSRYRNGTRAAPYSFYKSIDVEPNCRVRTKADSLSIPHKISFSKEFFRLLGFALSEGYFGKNGIEITTTSEQILKDLTACYVALFKEKPRIRKDIRADKYTDGVCYRLSLPVIFEKVLEKLGVGLVKAKEKEVPSFVFHACKENILEFLDAYFLGDGSQYEDYFVLFTASKKMASGLSLLTYLIGKKSGVSHTKGMYAVSIANQKLRDPYWPLWDYTRELYGELRKSGLVKQEINALLANSHKNARMKTASREKLLQLINILQEGSIKEALTQILQRDIKTERVVSIKEVEANDYVYDLEVPGAQNFLCGPHPIFAHNSMDAPLLVSTILNPAEVDDEVYDVDTGWSYPKEFYLATQRFEAPSSVPVEQIKNRVGKPEQYEGMGYTHEVKDMNAGVRYSAYKSIPTMVEKMAGQMDLAEKIRAVDACGVATLVIDKHFIRDIKGNLRKMFTQQYRCVKCNEKFRRPPLAGICTCGGKLLFTITEGSIKKYLEPSLTLAQNSKVSAYLQQSLMVIKRRVDSIFGEERTKQIGLGGFFK